MHEEPIVCTPSDAIRSFQEGGLDYLAMGNFLLRHPEAKPRQPARAALELVAVPADGQATSKTQRRASRVATSEQVPNNRSVVNPLETGSRLGVA